MVLRRASFYWQFVAALVLPSWVLVGRGIIRSEFGWDFVLYLVLCPILCVAMLVVAGVTSARKSVRDTRTLSWRDTALLLVWHAAIITSGFYLSGLVAAAVVVVGIVAFWSAVFQLFTETRARVKSAFSLDPIDAGTYTAEGYRPDTDAGPVIIINPDGTKEELPDS